MTHEHFRAIVDRLKSAKDAGKNVKPIQTNTGVNYNPNGLLFDEYVMNNIIEMPRVYLRDGMHTMSSNGVAGTHLALMAQAIVTVGVSYGILQSYCQKFRLPRARGSKPSDLYFKMS